MDNLVTKRQETVARWRELVDATAADTDALVATFTDEVKRLPAYQSGLVEDEDLFESAYAVFDLLMEAIRSGVKPGELTDHPGLHGRKRARQGVPVKDLIEAVRLDFDIIWSSLLAHAAVEDMVVLALHVDELWAVVDDYARAIHQSYLEELAEQAVTAVDAQRGYLAELFSPARLLRINLERIARALGVDADSRFAVVVGNPDVSPRMHRAAAQLRATGTSLFVLNQPDRVVSLWAVADSDHANGGHDAIVKTMESFSASTAAGYVPTVDGLAAVPDAADVAFDILVSLEPQATGLVTVQEGWARMARGSLDRRIDFTDTLLAGLDALPEGERSRVVQAVPTYLDTGSVRDTSNALFCHRNTVLNRLSKFRSATGLDVQSPRQAALVVLALS